MAEIAIRAATKTYDGGVVAVDAIDLDVADGELLVLVGPSGCGKSTLLRMVAGLEEVTAGSIHIGGRDVTDLAPKDRDVAMVFQSYALYPHMTVRRNIGYPLRLAKVAKPDLDADFHGRRLRDVVMEPTRIYVKPLLALMQAMPGAVKGMAHITGGGLTENVPRILRDEFTARIDAASWALPPLFQWLQQAGNVDMQEMYRVFNCGIGMVVVVAAADADSAAERLAEREAGEGAGL